MYSIILKLKSNCDCGCGCKIDNTKPSSPKERWKYLTNADGSIYQEEDLEKVRLKCIELLSDNLLSSIKVVQNKAATAYVQIEGAPDPHVSTLPTVTDADNGKVLMVIEGEWGVSEVEVLPNVTLSDNGKILKVVDGTWTVADEVVNTDSKVTQTNVTTNGEYRVLLSKQADDAEHTDTVLKSGQFIYNPYENHMNVIKNTDNLYTESYVSDDSLGVFNWDKANDVQKSLRVEYNDITLSGQTWDGTNASLKNALAAAGGGGGGGSTIVIEPTLSAGTKIADYSIDGVNGILYTPSIDGKQDVLTPGANIDITNGVISATDTTYDDFAGSAHGLVPSVSAQTGKYLKDDGTWDTPPGAASDFVPPTTATAGTHGLVPAPSALEKSNNRLLLASDGTWGLEGHYEDSQFKDAGAPMNFYLDGNGDPVIGDTWTPQSKVLETDFDKGGVSYSVRMNDNYQTQRSLMPNTYTGEFTNNYMYLEVQSEDAYGKNKYKIPASTNTVSMNITAGDIELSSTWDGTHTSLKDSIGAIQELAVITAQQVNDMWDSVFNG